jgi:VanZ family protein
MNFKLHSFWILWAIVVLVLTLMPGEAIPNVPIFGIDKLVHFFIFGTLNLLMLIAFKKQETKEYLKICFFSSIGYGILIEFIQPFVPGRTFSIYDMIANTIGVILGYAFFRLLLGRKLV